MDHQKIFYTNLFVIDDFIPTATNAEKERIEGMKKYISDLWSKRDYDDNWQTSTQDTLLKLSYDSTNNTNIGVNSSGNLTIDSNGDIELNAAGGNITFYESAVPV